jgi:hypothetical protein
MHVGHVVALMYHILSERVKEIGGQVEKKARSQLTSDIKPSWSHLSRNIAYPMQVLNKLLRYTTPWLATGVYRSAESSLRIPRSRTALSPSSYANAHAAKS